MIEYRETFLDKMKVLFPHFIDFSENGSILPKDYPKDCAVDRSIKNKSS